MRESRAEEHSGQHTTTLQFTLKDDDKDVMHGVEDLDGDISALLYRSAVFTEHQSQSRVEEFWDPILGEILLVHLSLFLHLK